MVRVTVVDPKRHFNEAWSNGDIIVWVANSKVAIPRWDRNGIIGCFRAQIIPRGSEVPEGAVAVHKLHPQGWLVLFRITPEEAGIIARTPEEKIQTFLAFNPCEVRHVKPGTIIFAECGGGAGSQSAARYDFEIIAGEPQVERIGGYFGYAAGAAACPYVSVGKYRIILNKGDAVAVSRWVDVGRIESSKVLYVADIDD